MLFIFICFFCFFNCDAYFTLPGKCPENIGVQEQFKLADFFGKWYQTFHYSSDQQILNNCSSIELITRSSGIYLNQSRIDRGLFHRYSLGRLEIPSSLEDAAKLDVTFVFKDAPRRLVTRRYPFHILATNYKYYATVYTCQYSALINKHFMYVWLLSRHPILNDVSKELALKPLERLGLTAKDLIQDDRSKCSPKYYEDMEVEPFTFRWPVPI